ncbi:MAG: Flagellum-specific synthase FliI [Frankiales bacterium]|nr:Flagellum-specific synthase FliI [Frankiales bacterium]
MTTTSVAEILGSLSPVQASGRISRVVGLEAECKGLRGSLGDVVAITVGDRRVPAQVVAVREDALLLAPYGELDGVAPGAQVEPTGSGLRMRVGPDLAGRVLDALGRPIDDGPALTGELTGLDAPVPHPLKRQRISAPLTLGVRCLDTMTPCGRGQRVGIFAGSGVGKSTLLGMMARGTRADVIVVGLVGERGREVREFLEDDLGEKGRERVVCVVATSDEPPLMRLRAAYTATRIAEHYRDQGLDVLLLVDSLTRFAMARREIGLAAGEPPATRGYPPSVFAELPRLLERAGPGETGTITALYTVLVEGDDMNDPVADHARSILDGHIVLSRRLAAAGHFPTVDVLESVSRLASKVTPRPRLQLAARLRRLLAAADEAKDLVEIGAYQHGSDPDVDEALARRELMSAFLRQPVDEVADSERSWEQLSQVLA